MKLNLKWLVLPLMAFVCLMAACDDDDDKKDDKYTPGAPVLATFFKMFPNVVNADWEQKSGYDVADFKYENKEKEVWFMTDGTWMLTETDMPLTVVPKVILDAFTNGAYATWALADASYLERKDMLSVYVLTANKDGVKNHLYYTDAGMFLKAITVTKDNEDFVPTPVNENILKSIQQLYPTAKIVELQVANNLIYVDLLNGGVMSLMVFDLQYQWIRTEWAAAWSTVPQLVKNSVVNAGYSINENTDIATLIVRPNPAGSGNQTIYRVTLRHEGQDIVLYFTEDGTPTT